MYSLLIPVATLAVVASAWDLKTYRIPNWLTLGAIVVGLILNIVFGGLLGLSYSVMGMFAGSLILLPFFFLGGMGGGDVKLGAAFGALGGPHFLVITLLWGSLIGGIAALCMMIRRKGFGGAVRRAYHDLVAVVLFRSGSGKDTGDRIVMPYGVYISMGAMIALILEVKHYA